MSNATTKALEMLQAITANRDFTIPDIDFDDAKYQFPDFDSMYDQIPKLTIEDLTTREVNGEGAFDALMESVNKHIRSEYDKGRITGAEYSKTYIAAMQAAMGTALQFVISKDAAYWQAQQAQIQAITARIEFETAKVRHALMFIEANNAEANFALTATRLANEEITYNTGTYNLENLLPNQNLLLGKQVIGQELQNDTLEYGLNNTLPQQLVILEKQETLLVEQTEVQRAQTLDTRSDGLAITGSLGKQKDLYSQQITSYQRDAEVKATRMFTDAWITQKTIDEGLTPPDAFANASLQTILETIKTNNNIG